MTKKTPEEIRAQQEDFLAARAAKAARGTPPPAPEEKVAKPTGAEPSAEKELTAANKPKSRPETKPKTAKPASQATPAKTASAVEAKTTRREFLNYAWLASLALFSVELVGLSLWFTFPNFKARQFGGQFDLDEAAGILPEVNAPPVPYTDGKFWLVNLDLEGDDGEPRKGILALYKVCTHLGCLYDWVDMTNRFECPCHGSKFALTGDYLIGPAPRSLDRFVIQAISPDGTVKETNGDGDPLVIDGDEILVVDTGKRILGEPHA